MLTPAQRRIIAQKAQLKRLRYKLMYGGVGPIKGKIKLPRLNDDWEMPPLPPLTTPAPRFRRADIFVHDSTSTMPVTLGTGIVGGLIAR